MGQCELIRDRSKMAELEAMIEKKAAVIRAGGKGRKDIDLNSSSRASVTSQVHALKLLSITLYYLGSMTDNYYCLC